MFMQHPDIRIREAFEAVVKRLEALEAHQEPAAAVQVPEPVPPAPEAPQEPGTANA